LPAGPDEDALDVQSWMGICQAVIAKPLVGQPASEEDRELWPWWKAKKWACQITSRFFTRYGNPHYADPSMAPFAEVFSKQYAPMLLEQVMNTLALRPRGEYCTDRVVHACLSFVTSAMELSHTYKLLKPHLDFLLFEVVFPVLCLSNKDIEAFETDPREYIHKNNDPTEDFLSPRIPAVNLLTQLAKHRGKECLPKVCVCVV
ncbi:unnamed protein product, partial [Choristocarpus tenellus]